MILAGKRILPAQAAGQGAERSVVEGSPSSLDKEDMLPQMEHTRVGRSCPPSQNAHVRLCQLTASAACATMSLPTGR